MLVARRPGKQQDISYSFSAQLSCISSIWYIYLPCLERKPFLSLSDYQSEELLLQIITCLDHSLYYLLPKGAKKDEILTERESSSSPLHGSTVVSIEIMIDGLNWYQRILATYTNSSMSSYLSNA